MTKNNKFLIILLTILNGVVLIKSNELLELVCSSDANCSQFKHSGIQSFCYKEQCKCSTRNGETVKCKPLKHMVSNVIGGKCPCYRHYSECDYSQIVCYCIEGYRPSDDRRRCLKETVALNGICEEHQQCQSNDVNSVCWKGYQMCFCKNGFAEEKGKCASAVDTTFLCRKDSECKKLYGSNTKCGDETPWCLCTNNHHASVNHTTCLKSKKYLQFCNETVQCTDALGVGGQCRDNRCQCNEKYFAIKKRSSTGYIQTVCSPFTERGQYCRYDKDCYEHHLTKAEQTMICNYGNCNCKMGHHVDQHNKCVRGREYDPFLSLILFNAVVLIVIVNLCFIVA